MKYDSKRILESILKIINNRDKLNLDSELEKFLVSFSKIPRDNQIIIINSLIDSYNLQEQEEIKRKNEEICFREGHKYGDWYEAIGYNHYWKYKYWAKKCERCDFMRITYDKPDELVKNRKK